MSELHGVTDINNQAERLAEEERLRRLRESSSNSTYQAQSNSADIGIGLLNSFNAIATALVEKEQSYISDNVKASFNTITNNDASANLRQNLLIENQKNQLQELQLQAQTLRDNVVASEKAHIECSEKKAELSQLYNSIHTLENTIKDSGSSFYTFGNLSDANKLSETLAQNDINCNILEKGGQIYVKVDCSGFNSSNGTFESTRLADNFVKELNESYANEHALSSMFDEFQPASRIDMVHTEDKYATTDKYGQIIVSDDAKKAQAFADANFMGGTLAGLARSMEGFNDADLNAVSNLVNRVVASTAQFNSKVEEANRIVLAQNVMEQGYVGHHDREVVEKELKGFNKTLDANGKVVDIQGVKDMNAISAVLMKEMASKENGNKAVENWTHSKALQKLSSEYVDICKKHPNLPRDRKGNIDVASLKKLNKSQLEQYGLSAKQRDVLVKVGDYAVKNKLLEKNGLMGDLKSSFNNAGKSINFFMKNTFAGATLSFGVAGLGKLSAKAMSQDEETAQLANFSAKTAKYTQKLGQIANNNVKLIKNAVKTRLNKTDNGLIKKIRENRENLRKKRALKKNGEKGVGKYSSKFKKADKKLSKSVQNDLKKYATTPFGRYKQFTKNLKAKAYERFASTKVGHLVSTVSSKVNALLDFGKSIGTKLMSFAGTALGWYVAIAGIVSIFLCILCLILDFVDFDAIQDKVVYRLYKSMYEQERQWLYNLQGIQKDEQGHFTFELSAENADYYLKNPNRYVYDQAYGMKLLDIGRYSEYNGGLRKNNAPFMHIFYTDTSVANSYGIVTTGEGARFKRSDPISQTSLPDFACITGRMGTSATDIARGTAPQIYVDPFFTPNRVQSTANNSLGIDYFTIWDMMKPIGIGKQQFYNYYAQSADLTPNLTIAENGGINITSGNTYINNLLRADYTLTSKNISRSGKTSEATLTQKYGWVRVHWVSSRYFGVVAVSEGTDDIYPYILYDDALSRYNSMKSYNKTQYCTIVDAKYNGDSSSWNTLNEYQQRWASMVHAHKTYSTYELKLDSDEILVNTSYPWNDNDVISVVTIEPNLQLASGLSFGGHTSNIKDIICMLDVMMQFNEEDKLDNSPYFKQDINDNIVIFTLKEWANKVIHTFRLVAVLFDPDYSMYDWNTEYESMGVSYKTLSTYCQSLFELTHQQYAELSVVYYYTNDAGNRDFVIYSYSSNESTDDDGNIVNTSPYDGENVDKKPLISMMMEECPDYDPNGLCHYDNSDSNVSTYGCHITDGFIFRIDSASSSIKLSVPTVYYDSASSSWKVASAYWLDNIAKQRIERFVSPIYNETSSFFDDGEGGTNVTPCFGAEFLTTNSQPQKTRDINLAFQEYTYHKIDDALNEPCWQVTTIDSGTTKQYPLSDFMINTTPSFTAFSCNDGHATGQSKSFNAILDGYGVPQPYTTATDNLGYFASGTVPYPNTYTSGLYQFFWTDNDGNVISSPNSELRVNLNLSIYVPVGRTITCGQTIGQGKVCDDHCTASGSHSSHTCNSSCFCKAGHGHELSCYSYQFTHYQYRFTWKCSGNHTAEMCGGHLILDNYGLVYSFMDEDVDIVEEFIGNVRDIHTDDTLIGAIGNDIDYTSFSTARNGYLEGTTTIDPTSRYGYGIQFGDDSTGRLDYHNINVWKYAIPYQARQTYGLNLMPVINGGETIWYRGKLQSIVGGSLSAGEEDDGNIFTTDDPVQVSPLTILTLIRNLNDIFSADVNIEYGVKMFPISRNTDNYKDYEGWTSDNMYIAMLKYCMSWEDIYEFEITVNNGITKLGDDDIKAITDELTVSYGETLMNERRTLAVTLTLKAVGRASYSAEHHNHCYYGKDCDTKRGSVTVDSSHYCEMTDTSGFASYVYGLRNNTFVAKSCSDFWNMGSSYTYGNTLNPLDILVSNNNSAGLEGREGDYNHCYIYVGHIDNEVSTKGIYLPANSDLWVHCTIKNEKMGNVYLEINNTGYGYINNFQYCLGAIQNQGICLTDSDGNNITYRKVAWN